MKADWERPVLKKFFESLLEVKAPGPYPSFSVVHVLKALELIAEEGPIGRGKLSRALGTGEGSTRTLIARIKGAGLITISKSGCALTKKGEKVWKQYRLVFPQKVRLGKSELTLDSCSVAVLVKEGFDRVKAGLEQRDAAVMEGAMGATTLVFVGEKLIVPSISQDVARDFPTAYRQIVRRMSLEEKDVVVIGSAQTWSKAEYGAIAAAWTLVEDDCG